MNCSRIHQLLSLNLDGRLSSSRRETLLDHLAECGDCARLAEEMREAQQLALQLPTERIGPNFQETLWERIRAGEGTPEGVFHEQVPLATRVRYVASGAAAAALFLLALNWMAPPTVQMPTENSVEVAQIEPADAMVPDARPDPEIARVLDEPGPSSVAAAPVAANAPGGRVSPPTQFNPQSVALVARQTANRSLEDVRVVAQRYQSAKIRISVPVVRSRLARPVRALDGAARLMRWMADENFIVLPGALQAELRLAEHSVRAFEKAAETEQTEELISALNQFTQLDIRSLQSQFYTVCCDTAEAFRARLNDHVVQNPQLFCVFGGTITNSNELAAPVVTNPFEELHWVQSPEVLLNRTPQLPTTTGTSGTIDAR